MVTIVTYYATIIMGADFVLRFWRSSSVSINQWIGAWNLILIVFLRRFTVFQLSCSCCSTTPFGRLSYTNLDSMFVKFLTLGTTFARLYSTLLLFVLLDVELFRFHINQSLQLIAFDVYWFAISYLTWQLSEVTARLILTMDIRLWNTIWETVWLTELFFAIWVWVKCVASFTIFVWAFALEWALSLWVTCIAIDSCFLTNCCFGTW